MDRTLTRVLTAAAVLVTALATAADPATAQSPQQQSPFPPAPQQSVFPSPSQQSVFPSPSQQQSTVPASPQQSPFGSPPPQASAPICAQFPALREEAQKKAGVVQAIGSHKPPDRAKMCAAVTQFSAAEGRVVKFIEDNKTVCGVPQEAITNAKAIHANTEKFREQVCTEGPKPKAPTLSDAIGAPVDTKKNTSSGRGTLDTLTGNPLAR